MNTSKKSNSVAALAHGDGGSSDQKQILPPLQSLAPEESQKPSSASVQQERLPISTRHGSQPLKSGKMPVLTEKSGSSIPNSTLAGTANWVLTLLQERGLIEFELASGANGANGHYRAMFPVTKWEMKENVLTLKSETE
jgi:hypothetical protein